MIMSSFSPFSNSPLKRTLPLPLPSRPFHFHLASKVLISPCPPPSVLVQKWSLPAEGWVKINVDAALGDSHSSLAMVVRDWRGTGVLAISRKANTSIPLQAEAEALLWAA
uniref:RNase H type-1 domain-containing protein n=1 Tax=Fagus sylvatica TaxID=28930 RepID=A0A2N9F9G4_FAGSY